MVSLLFLRLFRLATLRSCRVDSPGPNMRLDE
jgi:hypothetical protein